MKWNICLFIKFFCYFAALTCFCLALFLPSLVDYTRINSECSIESGAQTMPITQDIYLPGQKKKKQPKAESIPAGAGAYND